MFGRGHSADGLRAGRYQGHRRGGARARSRSERETPRRSAFGVHTRAPRDAVEGFARRLVLAPRVRVQAAPPHAPDGQNRRRHVPELGRASASVAFGVDAVRAGAGRSRRAARFVERPEPGVARHGGSERGDGRGSFDARARGPVRGRRLERSAGNARGAQGALLVDALGQKPVADWVVTSRGGGNNNARDSLAVIRSHFRFRRRRPTRRSSVLLLGFLRLRLRAHAFDLRLALLRARPLGGAGDAVGLVRHRQHDHEADVGRD